MAPQIARLFDEKKFMWDGKEYDKGQAEEIKNTYEKDGFETRLVTEDGKCFVYSRRVAAQQTATEGQ